jgi:hypothetical protein
MQLELELELASALELESGLEPELGLELELGAESELGLESGAELELATPRVRRGQAQLQSLARCAECEPFWFGPQGKE